MKKYTIILFKGIYDTLDLFSDQLAEVFFQWGYEIFIYNAQNEEKSKIELLKLLNNRKAKFAAVTYNNMGYNLEIEGANIWEYFDIPYVNILMDHPFHFERPLRDAPNTAIVLCTDRNHVKNLSAGYFYKSA